LSHVNLPNN